MEQAAGADKAAGNPNGDKLVFEPPCPWHGSSSYLEGERFYLHCRDALVCDAAVVDGAWSCEAAQVALNRIGQKVAAVTVALVLLGPRGCGCSKTQPLPARLRKQHQEERPPPQPNAREDTCGR
ncbi:hypothetical protein CIHG_09801 [Coccidioides immitis H538.4]|uniref:Uncharacterized protein n=2 Tax=Coccidioides immitis TaxID=5501 RepID=A0A0J8S3C7_COCIT|nr:hypothetical protein CIRG_09039 [Coccidioides immitis RMSCC 2394]KMU91955.1 hypothetical protein CIHG_09801 [Coccidioides immitis H538.4]